jgi:hypothetical protein
MRENPHRNSGYHGGSGARAKSRPDGGIKPDRSETNQKRRGDEYRHVGSGVRGWNVQGLVKLLRIASKQTAVKHSFTNVHDETGNGPSAKDP